MARLNTCTKAQLAAQLEQAHVAYEVLRTKYEALVAERRTTPAPSPAPSPAPGARRAAMQQAREEAMRSGRVIRAF